MKRSALSLIILILCSRAIAEQPFAVQNPLVIDFQSMLKLVRDNLNGWSRLSFDGGKNLWTPSSFYAQKKSDPKKWIAQIRELGFCQPDKLWKEFPVLSVSNDLLSSGFEQVAANPNINFNTQMVYYETVIVGGKARNVSYDYRQSGPIVNVACSAANEIGDVQTIAQSFDIRNPKEFKVEQKKNGKHLEI